MHYYQPFRDHINVPPLKDYENSDEYYSTLFHEMIHSTGHKSRLDREGIPQTASFRDEVYSKEELVAEMGAAMLCGVARTDNSTLPNSAAYIQSWLRTLERRYKISLTRSCTGSKSS
ncbi:zincin-like metallopeptidase domain-containing protein [Siminovitchia sp. 179-K 8D1 HS]|uniref:zincin-like metallopeptidase domain-containing protein n=1 Tax=Siminovitchia sp. 179-K 8D1 HS TaxID=3142385 RepID=UPI0039A15931